MLKLKRIFVAMLCMLLALPLCTACGNASQRALVGVWELTDGEDTGYGFGLKFNKDGTMYYGLSSTDMEGNGAMSDEEWEALLKAWACSIPSAIKQRATPRWTLPSKCWVASAARKARLSNTSLMGIRLCLTVPPTDAWRKNKRNCKGGYAVAAAGFSVSKKWRKTIFPSFSLTAFCFSLRSRAAYLPPKPGLSRAAALDNPGF